MDKTSLGKLGLSESETQIYFELLKSGPLTATNLAKITKFNRSHIYDKLDVLMQKGFVSAVIKNNTKYFNACQPEKIMDYVEEMRDELSNIIPQLNKIKKESQHNTVVELYQGKDGIKTILKDIIREKKDYCVFGEEGQLQEALPVFISQFLRDVKSLKMQERLLSKESKRKKIVLTPKNTEIRYLQDKYFSPTTTAVYGNKMAIFIWSEPVFAILVDNKDVAESFKSYFNVLWGLAKQ